jgi:hypothetical protein
MIHLCNNSIVVESLIDVCVGSWVIGGHWILEGNPLQNDTN